MSLKNLKPQNELIKDFINKRLNDEYIGFYGTWDSTQIPEEIGFMQNLKSLNIDKTDISSLPESIGNLFNLEELIIGQSNITEIPKEIKKLKKLRKLQLHVPLNDYSFLNELTQLQILVISESKLLKIPPAIAKMKKLRILNLSKNDIINYPDWMCKLEELNILTLSNNPLKRILFGHQTKLEKLDLEYCNLSSLPESLGMLTALKSLNLYKNRIIKLPDSISNLSHLESMNIDKNPFDEFPDNISGLSALKYFQFENKWMSDFPPALLKLSSLTGLPKSKNVSFRAQIIPLLAKECRKKNYSEEYSLFLLELLAERVNKLESFPNFRKYLIEAMNCGIPAIHATVIDILSKSVPSFDKNAVIAFAGSSSFNMTELKSRLKSLEIGYSSKLNSAVTHVVLGKSPKKLTSELVEGKYILISEKSLMDFLNSTDTPYLLEENRKNENSANLSFMLASRQPDSVAVAIELLIGGGVQEELITDLILIYFGQEEKNIKQKTRKLLEQYGPASLLPSYSKVNDPVRNLVRITDINKFFKNFERLCNEHNLDRLKILNYHFNIHYKNSHISGIINSLLLKHLPEKEAEKFLLDLIKDGKLDFSHYELEVIPEKLLKDKNFIFDLKTILLSSCGLKKIPDFVLECTNLLEINLYGNSLANIPKEFMKLKNLKNFYADFNSFKEFPAVLLNMESLTEIRLGYCKIKTLPESLTNLKKLKCLELPNCLFETVPKVLHKMTGLKNLSIKKTFKTLLYSEKEKKELQSALPDCNVQV